MLYPNQFVNARLLVDTMHNTVRVPVPAVQRGEPGTFVYVINPDNTVSVRPIKVGPVDDGYEAVLSGLKPGERVVTDGTDRLRDGALVSLPAQSGAAADHGQPLRQGSMSIATSSRRNETGVSPSAWGPKGWRQSECRRRQAEPGGAALPIMAAEGPPSTPCGAC